MDKEKDKLMRIAVIGGGRRCRTLIEMLDAKRFPRLKAQIVAVADPDENAVGIGLARERGIFTTTDYRDFFRIPGLDLVIELTGQEELLEDFLQHNPAKVQILEATISRLFSDVIRLREEYLFRERQLELIETIVDSVFSSIRDRVLIMRPDYRIVDANDALLSWVGMKKEEIVGKFCYQVTHRCLEPCHLKGSFCPLKESLETGGVGHAIHEHYGPDNEVRYCEVTTVPLKNRKGQIELILEIVRDITDELEKKLEKKAKALKRDLARLVHEDKMIALGKLVASAVHEINNPLSGIHALARLMRRQIEEDPASVDTEQFQYYLGLIDSESARCSTIVGNLLSFSRQKKMEQRPFQLNDVVERVVLLSKHKMELRKIQLHLDLESALPQIMGDPSQIQQCLINLIFNAMEAITESGDITIRTRLEEKSGLVRLEVEDTGVGIAQEMMSQIFEPFFTTKNHDKGVGLGLSVVYGIIKEHRGTIYVKSEVGKGSNFIIRFPRADSDSGRAPGEKIIETDNDGE